MIKYIEQYYIGSAEKAARFDIKTWNVNQRVLLGLPRTSNKLERFNKEFSSDSGDYHQATHDRINNLRLEQGQTEKLLLKIKMGEENPRNQLQVNLDNALKGIIEDYDPSDIFSFMINFSLTIEKHSVLINKAKGKKVKKVEESDESD
jgi:hypothetical protein